MNAGTPAAEFPISRKLVIHLLRDQFPNLAQLPVEWLDSGWDNEMYRLGSEYVVRLPRRALAVEFIRNEQKWLPKLADMLPIATPSPILGGQANQHYPWPWSVQRWLHGCTADLAYPPPDQACLWADFLLALHQPATANAPCNAFRGVPLARHQDAIEQRLGRLGQTTDLISRRVLAVWNESLGVPDSTQRRWIHGDLHARNVLVQDGKFTGVIDWGDLTAGDSATDLASIWMLFDDRSAQEECCARYGATTAQIACAMGWAVSFGTALLDTGRVDNRQHAEMGAAILRRLTQC